MTSTPFDPASMKPAGRANATVRCQDFAAGGMQKLEPAYYLASPRESTVGHRRLAVDQPDTSRVRAVFGPLPLKSQPRRSLG
jgi:hypothetical protein